MQYVYGYDDIVAQFVAQLVPDCARGFGRCKAMGVIDAEGKLIAGVVYHNWQPEAGVIEISVAALPGKRWLNRETLRRVYEFPFDQCECQMVMHLVPYEQEHVLRQLAATGYTFVRVPRMYGRERDGVLCMLTEEDWRANKFNTRKDDVVQEAA